MIDAAQVVEWLRSRGVDLFTGVPDSVLKSFCSHLARDLPPDQHVLAASEGGAVGVAIGHYLRTQRPAAVYLQNSGLGNAINPLVSLADPEVYGIPMLLLVGWRGKPGEPDEPQHVKQGRVQGALLDSLELPWAILPREAESAESCLHTAIDTACLRSGPYVVMIQKGTIAETSETTSGPAGALPTREEALIALTDALGPDTVNVSTTGMLSRELFEQREQAGSKHNRDFLTVGGMGHASSIALGVALRERDREVWCLDGDGALLMHLGSLPVIAQHAPQNFFHVVFNNGVHDSVGGQATAIRVVDVPKMARALGYRGASATSDLDALADRVASMRATGGPVLLELTVRPGSRPNLGRPTSSQIDNKIAFMRNFA